MATKLKENQIKQLKAVGVTGVSTEEDARKKLVKYLGDNEVDNVEDESLSDLINMAEAFYDGGAGSETEEELDDLASETEEEEEAEDESEEEEEEEEVEEEEEEEEVEEKPKKKPADTKKPASVTKTPEKKEAKKTPVVVRDENNVAFDARNNEDHREFLGIFEEIFPEDDFEIKILKQGFTIRLKGNNAQPTIMNFDELRIIDNEFLKGNMYCNRLKNVEELESYMTEELLEEIEIPKANGKGVDYKPAFVRGMFRGETHPSIKGVTQDQVFEILGVTKNKKGVWSTSEDGYLAEALLRATGTDKKMGENRDKMEQKLEASKAPEKKKSTTKK